MLRDFDTRKRREDQQKTKREKPMSSSNCINKDFSSRNGLRQVREAPAAGRSIRGL